MQKSSIQFNNVNTSGDGVNYRIKYSIPQYTLYSYNNNGTTVVHSDWGTETKQNFLKFDSITKQNMYFSPKYITDDDGIFQTGFTTLSPRVKLNTKKVGGSMIPPPKEEA